MAKRLGLYFLGILILGFGIVLYKKHNKNLIIR